MNATNRVLNRAVLLVIGLVLLALGAATVAAACWPAAKRVWGSWTTSALAWMHQADQRSRLWSTASLSWFVLALLVALTLVVLFAIVVITHLGGGRSSDLVRLPAEEGNRGTVRVEQGFAADALASSLAGHDDILATRVSLWRVKGEQVMHVVLTPRQNTSPVEVASTVTGLLDNLGALTGASTPTVVSLHAGVRSRLAADQSRVN